MSDQPNLHIDIDSLFQQMGGVVEELDWHFVFQDDDVQKLEKLANDLTDEFEMYLQDNVEEMDDDGNVTLGGPALSVVQRGELTAAEVHAIADRMQSIADERGVEFAGVDCYDPVDEDEDAIYGWIVPDDAGWRLQHMTECGLEPDAELPWTFLVTAASFEKLVAISAALDAAGFDDIDEYNEPDEDGEYGLCLFIDGRNDESELTACAEKIAAVAQNLGGCLSGIQFYTREELAEIFSVDDED
jgi:hypothetical protein